MGDWTDLVGENARGFTQARDTSQVTHTMESETPGSAVSLTVG